MEAAHNLASADTNEGPPIGGQGDRHSGEHCEPAQERESRCSQAPKMTPRVSLPAPICDFGGVGPLLHLAHANGFPPGTYRPLIEALTDHYRVVALPSRPLWPASQPESAPNWHPLVNDLIEGFDRLGWRGVIGVGHSMGGVLTLWAAVRRPDLFRAVVLIDPVILPPAWLWLVRAVRLLGLQRRLPPVQAALHRRRNWPNRQTCFERYRRTPFFAGWPDESLWAYVEAGTRERSDGQVELVYPPEWEAQIFATTPTDIWKAVPRLRAPALVIRGEHSSIFRPQSQTRMERLLPLARFVVMPGAGHLVPMERPKETGAAIREFLDPLSG